MEKIFNIAGSDGIVVLSHSRKTWNVYDLVLENFRRRMLKKPETALRTKVLASI